jgi:branched-chain amino acid transport system permease protein
VNRATVARRAAITLGGLALVAYPLVRLDDVYGQSVLIFTFLLAVMASGWNIMAGFTGYVSIGQSAFLGIGAYTVALLALRTGLSPLLLAPLGGVAAALVAAVLGATVMRAREHAFVIITIALLFLFQTLALNLEGLTGGSNGLTLPLPAWDRDIQNLPFYYLLLGLLALSVLLSWWIRRTKFGMGLIAIREDEDKAAAIGVRTSAYKVLSFVASAVLIGVAGGVYAYYLTFIDPRGMFDILISVQLVLAALVGGRGAVATGRQAVDAAVAQTRDFLLVMRDRVARVHARGGSLKEAFQATHEALAPTHGGWPIFEHCLPFNVQRLWDELDGIDWPRIWTVERDREVWDRLQG